MIVIRANESRHRALSAYLRHAGLDVFEIVEDNRKKMESFPSSNLIKSHFTARNVIEGDFFDDLINCKNTSDKAKSLPVFNCNSEEALGFSQRVSPNFIITFGCSILSSSWVNKFADKILGIHLGLSPYYRGSGTNFFPIVNRELSAIGFTLMNLDEGIDTGNIVQQKRAEIVIGDGIHTIGNRVIKNMFKEIEFILKTRSDLSEAIAQPKFEKSYFYRKRDFNEHSLRVALDNLNSGLIEEYLSRKEEFDSNFPLVDLS